MTTSRLAEFLITAALCAMVCDGEIHPSEMEELRAMVKTLPMFQGENLDDILEVKIRKANKDSFRLFEEYFEELRFAGLDTYESLQVMEVILRTIHADARIDPSELQFTLATIRVLNLPMEIIVGRFGEIPFLTQFIDGADLENNLMSSPKFRKMIGNWGIAGKDWQNIFKKGELLD